MAYQIIAVAINKHNPDIEEQIREHGFVDNIIIEEGKKAVCTFRIMKTGVVMAIDAHMHPITELEFHEILDKVSDEGELVGALKQAPFTPFTKKDLDDLLKRITGVRGYKVSR